MLKELPFIWVQVKNKENDYTLVDGETGEIIFENVCSWFCDTLFKWLDHDEVVYVRQFN